MAGWSLSLSLRKIWVSWACESPNRWKNMEKQQMFQTTNPIGKVRTFFWMSSENWKICQASYLLGIQTWRGHPESTFMWVGKSSIHGDGSFSSMSSLISRHYVVHYVPWKGPEYKDPICNARVASIVVLRYEGRDIQGPGNPSVNRRPPLVSQPTGSNSLIYVNYC